VNNLTKILFLFVLLLAAVMVVMKNIDPNWYRYLMRFVLLFSYIIPISLRVNLDMAKLFYAWQIGRDKVISFSTLFEVHLLFTAHSEHRRSQQHHSRRVGANLVSTLRQDGYFDSKRDAIQEDPPWSGGVWRGRL
jgi:hypothetical protein